MSRATTGSASPTDSGVFFVHLSRARKHLQEERYDVARNELELALLARPTDEDVLNLLSVIEFKRGYYNEAAQASRALLKNNPNSCVLHSNLGLILFKAGVLGEAEQELRRAIDLQPDHVRSHLYLGLLYRMRGKLGLALEHLRFAGAKRLVGEIEEALRKSMREPAGRATSAPGRPGASAPPSILSPSILKLADAASAEPSPRETAPASHPPAHEAAAAPLPPGAETPGTEFLDETVPVPEIPSAPAPVSGTEWDDGAEDLGVLAPFPEAEAAETVPAEAPAPVAPPASEPSPASPVLAPPAVSPVLEPAAVAPVLAPPAVPPVPLAPPAVPPVLLAPPAVPPVLLAPPAVPPVSLAPPTVPPVSLAPPALEPAAAATGASFGAGGDSHPLFHVRPDGGLEVASRGIVFVRKGSVVWYSGKMRFSPEPTFRGSRLEKILRADGRGHLFVNDPGRQAVARELVGQSLYVEGSRILALDHGLSFRLEPIHDFRMNRRVDILKIHGRGSVILSVGGPLLSHEVSPEFPLNVSSRDLVAWTGDLVPSVLEDRFLEEVMMPDVGSAPKIRFEGEGTVLTEPPRPRRRASDLARAGDADRRS